MRRRSTTAALVSALALAGAAPLATAASAEPADPAPQASFGCTTDANLEPSGQSAPTDSHPLTLFNQILERFSGPAGQANNNSADAFKSNVPPPTSTNGQTPDQDTASC